MQNISLFAGFFFLTEEMCSFMEKLVLNVRNEKNWNFFRNQLA